MNRAIPVSFALAALAGAGFYYFSNSTIEAQFLTACDGAMKDRLKSPSTYARVSANFRHETMQIGDYVDLKNKAIASLLPSQDTSGRRAKLYADQIQLAKDGKTAPTQTSALISYDVENSFGANIRASFDCNYIDDDGKDMRFNSSWVMIDGETLLDWTVRLSQN